METVATLEEVVELTKQLPLLDKVRLIERIAPQIERALEAAPPPPRRSLWGLCADLGPAPSDEDINEARQEAWADFPRDDI